MSTVFGRVKGNLSFLRRRTERSHGCSLRRSRFLIAGRLFAFIIKKNSCVWYENQFSALSSERLLRWIIQIGLQPSNNGCSALWKLVCGGGQAVHFLNNSSASTLVFGFNNARFSVSTCCPRAFSVWLFVVKSGTCCAGTADVTMKLLSCVCSGSSCHLSQ